MIYVAQVWVRVHKGKSTILLPAYHPYSTYVAEPSLMTKYRTDIGLHLPKTLVRRAG
jgi:hypothetical protein